MHVLMLGWEFPPFITGGLGTACYGLTKGLDRRGVKVTFVLPRAVSGEFASHVNILSPEATPGTTRLIESSQTSTATVHETQVVAGEPRVIPGKPAKEGFQNVTLVGVPAGFSHPYSSAPGDQPVGQWTVLSPGQKARIDPATGKVITIEHEVSVTSHTAAVEHTPPSGGDDYGGDFIGRVARYSRYCAAIAKTVDFDVVHAHDWMTFPAGLEISRVTGKPLVVHVHSTEFDRSGVHVNQPVYDIERRGMHGAMKVVAVSQLTKNLLLRRYGLQDRQVEVVYNGVDVEPTQSDHIGIQSKDKIVLYFGRITMQKGPEYFIQAAKRVLEVYENVKFVVAGSGDQAARMIEMAANMGIGHKVLFTGFLRGKDIKRVFAMADLYVMPSVSEPFGIAPLEAMAHDVPALISKTSGVSEVLVHALKCDFWDIDDMANKIVAVLRYPPLQKTLQEHGSFEVRRITWDGAAERCERVYRGVVEGMRPHARV